VSIQNGRERARSAARRSIVQRLARLSAMAVVCVGAACERPPAPPNVLVYVVDTLRADAVGCYGNASVHTPAIDRLAQEGTRFARAYANASWTRPSMGSLLTGEYPSTHGAVRRPDALRLGIPTLPARVRALHYRTAAVIANPNIGSSFGFADGFDDFVELYRPHDGRSDVVPEELNAPADRVVDAAIGWLHTHSAAPFFLFVFSIDPHAPYTPPPPYDRMYDPDYSGPVDGSLGSIYQLGLGGPIPPAREIRHLRALYDGEVSFNDAHLARLLTELDTLHLAANTVVVFTADHGEEFYEHGGRDHGHTLYEELVHVPLIIRWPSHVPAHTVQPGAVQLVDLLPTLLRIAGGSSGVGPGRDLTDMISGGSAPVASMAFAEEDLDRHQLHGLIREQHKLIYDAAQPQPLVFDLLRDPGEHAPLPGLPPQDLMLAMEAIGRTNHPPPGSTGRLLAPTELPESVRRAMEALGYGEPTKGP